MIRLKRAYEPASSSDGTRYLVERLWPRGVKKTALHIDAWLKDVAPSTALRQWFNHDPKKREEFKRRYRRELNANREALRPILSAAGKDPCAVLNLRTNILCAGVHYCCACARKFAFSSP